MKKHYTDLHIALTFDENYVTPFLVLLTSIFLNNKENTIVIHTIATGINDTEKQEIIEFVKSHNAEINFYTIDKLFKIEDLDSPYLSSTHYTIAVFYRLFFPFLVPENVKKLLYIDVDTVVINSLKKLYETNISPFPAGAVTDIAMGRNDESVLRVIGVDKDKYFNSGVLLMDIDLWKKQKITEQTLAFTSENKNQLKYQDQDALNYVLKDNWYKLSSLYNFTWDDVSIDLPKKEILKNKIVIVHYTGVKPWKFINHNRLRSYYYYYLKKSPRSLQKRYTDFKWTKSNIPEFIKIRIIEFYLDHPWIKTIWKNIRKSKNLKVLLFLLVINFVINQLQF